MIDTPLTQADYTPMDPRREVLQEYVHALLARQRALDLLDTIHRQTAQIVNVMKNLLEGASPAGRAAKAMRIARAALTAQAQKSYHLLERRRDECIAAKRLAERRANTALQSLLSSRNTQSTSRPRNQLAAKHSRGRFKSPLSATA
jgi:hypothetical protein